MRLNRYLTYTAFAFCLASATSFVGCSDYDVPEGWGVDQLSDEYVLTLYIGSEGGLFSRASNPAGGEPGDGRELGQHNENNIENLELYYYEGGINTPDATLTRILYKSDVAYRPDVTTKPTDTELLSTEIKFQASETECNYQFKTGDHFIVVANMGSKNYHTLSELRNDLVEHAWTEPSTFTCVGDYNMFVMSNERESWSKKGTGSETDPHQLRVTIERVAARLDFCTTNSNPGTVPSGSTIESGKPALIYPVEDRGVEIGTMYITHVRPFNVMQKPAYLIKRSAPPQDHSDITYLAAENNYVSGDFDQFPLVLEEYTWGKPIDGSTPDFSGLYGATYFPSIASDAWFTSTERYRVHNTTSTDGFSANGISTNGDSYCKNYYVLDYANENTMRAAASTSNTVTGMLLRGIFKPKDIYSTVVTSSAALTPSDKSTSYKVGDNVYRFRPMLTDYNESNCVYFDNLPAAEAYMTYHGTTASVIDTYTNGVCYFPVYLRHDHGDDASPAHPAEATPMEFATVRNNIYRLKVSFTGPGYATIPQAKDIEPLGIKPYIFVRKWYQIKHDEIEI